MLDPETSLDRWQGQPLATEPMPTIWQRAVAVVDRQCSRPGMVALLVAFVLLMLAILAVAYVPDLLPTTPDAPPSPASVSSPAAVGVGAGNKVHP